MPILGKRCWAIAEGYIPEGSHGPAPQMTSHETACLLNAGDQDAQVSVTVYFADREPAGPYRLTVPARRTRHVRFNELNDPEPIPPGTDYASVIESDVPIVVQHTRLDSRQSELAGHDHGRLRRRLTGLPVQGEREETLSPPRCSSERSFGALPKTPDRPQ